MAESSNPTLLEKDGYSLLRLTRNLKEFIQCGRSTKTYLNETKTFLDDISGNLDAVEKYVKNFIGNPIDDELLKAKLRDIEAIKIVVSYIYTFAKEAVDADSLAIPFSLATFLNHKVNELEGGTEEISLVFLACLNMNYYKCNLKLLRDSTNYLGHRINGFKRLSDTMGILQFPYSQAKELLVNCILFHEMGHYLYEKNNYIIHFDETIRKNFNIFIQVQKIDPPIIQLYKYVQAQLLSWIEEIFADIFAIRISGPAFHFATLEVRQVLPSATEQDFKFSYTHPANTYRFQQHAKWLFSDGWKDVLNTRTPDIYERLEKCEGCKIDDFTVASEPPLARFKEAEQAAIKQKVHQWILRQLKQMQGDIEDKVAELLGELDSPFADFQKKDGLITKCLSHGVVPSTVYDNEGNAHTPNPITILNSGYFFYLNGMKELLERVISKSAIVEKRMLYEQRLSQWINKSIEDWQIITKGEQ